jgi:hypothetical protein
VARRFYSKILDVEYYASNDIARIDTVGFAAPLEVAP